MDYVDFSEAFTCANLQPEIHFTETNVYVVVRVPVAGHPTTNTDELTLVFDKIGRMLIRMETKRLLPWEGWSLK